MITFTTGDILSANAEALVNTVNCVGIMGRGVALQFKRAYPANFKAYAAACARGEVQPGHMFVHETGRLGNPRYIINFPTKRHWRGKSRIDDIESGLLALAQEIREREIRSIAMPPLGSGLGGLDWAQVKSRINAAMNSVTGVDVVVYEPGGGPADPAANRSTAVPKMTTSRAALVELIHRYLGGLMDPFVTLLEVHKLMYFLQTAGEPLKLAYTKGHYGPYAQNLRHLLHAIDGHLVTGYQDGGDAPDKQLQLVPGAFEDANAFLAEHPQTRALALRVAELIDGFESPFGLELLSTAHWLATRERAPSVERLVALTYAWNDRKHQFSPRQIRIAAETLARKGWIDPLPVEANHGVA